VYLCIEFGTEEETSKMLPLFLIGSYLHGITFPALLQFLRLGYYTGLMMAQQQSRNIVAFCNNK
jgi:hypothetical protein